jgi:hypothetical protein
MTTQKNPSPTPRTDKAPANAERPQAESQEADATLGVEPLEERIAPRSKTA